LLSDCIHLQRLFGLLSEDTFQELQNEFMEKHYHHFEDVEENKLVYTDIFTQYVSVILTVVHTLSEVYKSSPVPYVTKVGHGSVRKYKFNVQSTLALKYRILYIFKKTLKIRLHLHSSISMYTITLYYNSISTEHIYLFLLHDWPSHLNINLFLITIHFSDKSS
jgi:hypothetical protein